MEFHEYADLFPLMEGEPFEKLVASIKAEGQEDFIILYEGKILDGRNRYLACEKAGVPPAFFNFSELPNSEKKNPLHYVITKNLTRRHLTDLERSVVGGKLARMARGDADSQRKANHLSSDGASAPSHQPMTNAEVAKLMQVSRGSVVRAKTILTHAPERIPAILAGETTLTTEAKRCRPAKKARAAPDDRPKKQSKAAERRELDKKAARQKAQKVRSQTWVYLRDALHNLKQLSLPAEAVGIVRKLPSAGAIAAIVDRDLDTSLKWLQEFSNAWKDAGKGPA
jgi:hypothetical protein